MYYQSQPRDTYYFRKMNLGHWGISSHLHGFFELLCCTGGQLHIEIASQHYALQPGEAALIFPYQPHSFVPGGEGYLFTFEPELIAAFASQYANYLPSRNSFTFSQNPASICKEDGLFAIKSFLYAMCADAEKLPFVYAPKSNRVLLEKLFFLTEAHYADCGFSLEQLAIMTGYDYSYISKYFLQKTGMRYSDYLTQRRIFLAAKLLQKNASDNICDIAFACGYNNVRSFNRNFKKHFGITPQEFCAAPLPGTQHLADPVPSKNQ